jgi:hypothetical protein
MEYNFPFLRALLYPQIDPHQIQLAEVNRAIFCSFFPREFVETQVGPQVA